MRKIYPYILVLLQFSFLIYIAVSAPLMAKNIGGILVESTGLFLGVVAILIMKPGNFNITPTNRTNGELVTSGPYRIIRHPMYLAQIVAVIPLVVDYFSTTRLAVLLLLILVLLIKIEYEEKQLLMHFPDYKAYREKTKKLIPGIY